MSRTIEITFNNRSEGFVLPINPKTIELSEQNLNQRITLLNIGEINLIGNRGLIACTLSSFFPSPKSPHYKRADREPMDYINSLKKWKNSKKPVRLIISDSDVNLAMAIDKISHSINEGDGDIYYTLELSEYRFLNVPSVKVEASVQSNGLKERPNTKVAPKKYVVKKGDSLWAIAKKVYGDGAKYTSIYNANKELMDTRNQKSKAPQYTIYSGQELTLP